MAVIAAHDFTASRGSGFSFGVTAPEFANALRRMADRIDSGEVLPQSVTVRSHATSDDFTATHVVLRLVEKVPP